MKKFLIFILGFFCCLGTIIGQANSDEIGCHDQVNVTLGDSCRFDLEVKEVGVNITDPTGLSLIVDDGMNLNKARVDGPGLFNVGLFLNDSTLVCWSTVLAEDKTAPTILPPADDTLECWLIDAVLNNAETVAQPGVGDDSDDKNDLGIPTILDACDTDLTFDWSDIVEYGSCDDDFYAKIIRRFTTQDKAGNRATATQVITFQQVTPNMFDFKPTDNFSFDTGDNKWVAIYQTCDFDTLGKPLNIYPVFEDAFGNEVALDEANCGNTPVVEEDLFSLDCGYKEERTISVFEWCADDNAVTTTHTYQVKVGDFEAPLFDSCVYDQIDALEDGIDLLDYTLSQPDSILKALNEAGIDESAITGLDACFEFVSTGPMDCTASINTSLAGLRALFGDLLVQDCSEPTITTAIISYTDDLIGKVPTGKKSWKIGGYEVQGNMAQGIPIGTHAIVISAKDDCHNAGLGIVFFEVKDQVKPVAKCDDELRITLTEGDRNLDIIGYAQVRIEDVDEGSWDNCGPVSLRTRRIVDNASDAADEYEKKYGAEYRETFIEETGYSAWEEYVEFFCPDIGIPTEVQLEATDQFGNTSLCWLNVVPENGLNVKVNILPTQEREIFCDSSITMDNVHLFADLEVIGMQCNGPIVTYDIEANLDQCGAGYYIIRPLLIDGDNSTKNPNDLGDPNTNFVRVEVLKRHRWVINFPFDQRLQCGQDESDSAPRVIVSGVCDIIAISQLPEERFEVTDDPDACYKILRTFRAINWCQYEGEDIPEFPAHVDVFNGVPGFQQKAQWIVVYDNTDPVVSINAPDVPSQNNLDCSADTDISVNITDACSVQDIDAKVFINDIEEPFDLVIEESSASLRIGARRAINDYKIRVEVSDGCGNLTIEEAEFSVYDDKAPAPICQNGLVAELMPVDPSSINEESSASLGMAVVWASDFIASPVGDCSGQSTAQVPVGGGNDQPMVVEAAYSIYFEDSILNDPSWAYLSPYDDESTRGLQLTCAHLDGADEGLVNVRIYAEDQAGNFDYCQTFIRVQDNMAVCGETSDDGTIAGTIQTEDAAPVEDVEVHLSGDRNMNSFTAKGGQYLFYVGLGDFTIAPRKDDNHKNGVSTFDIILIQKHITGAKALDSPYKLIAADVNQSGSITVLDLIQIRKIVLNIDTEFPTNTSWKFVPANFTFDDSANPLRTNYPEVININNGQFDGFNGSFVAIKVGDVNGSVMVEKRAKTSPFILSTDARKLEANKTYTIPIYGKMKDVQGYQFSLGWNTELLDLVDIVEGIGGGKEHFGLFKDRGLLTTSFHTDAKAGKAFQDREILFALTIKAKASTDIKTAIHLFDQPTIAEAYTIDNQLLEPTLDYQLAEDTDNQLLANFPNPFNLETKISFYLEEEGSGRIEIMDSKGSTVWMQEGDFVKGHNEVIVKGQELPASGLYYYSIHCGHFEASEKMLMQR